MNHLGIRLEDYESLGNGFGVTNQKDVDQLLKALESGQITGRETTNSLTSSGAPLKVEDLEGTMHSITFDESDIKFWKRVTKMPAYNTVVEYLRLVSPGAERGGFVTETELPEEEDSVYQRAAELVKFTAVTKSVSLAMEMVNTFEGVGKIVQRSVREGTLWILRKNDRALAFGNANVIPQEYNGLYRQHVSGFTTLNDWHNSDNVIDMRDHRLSEAGIEDAALGVRKNYGFANLLMTSPGVVSDFVKNFHESKLIQPNTPQISAGEMGQRVTTFNSQFGRIELDDDIFLSENPPRKTGDAATSAKAPANIVPVGVAAVADAAGTRFGTDFDGDYFVGVAAINRYGESQVVALQAGLVTVAATESIACRFVAGAGAYAPTGYVIYRSKLNPTTALADTDLYPVFTISTAELAAGYDGAGAGLAWDRNRFIPGTEKAILIQNDSQVYSFKQLAPLMKLDLALLAQARRFMIMLYGTPVLYTPKKMSVIINIGKQV